MQACLAQPQALQGAALYPAACAHSWAARRRLEPTQWRSRCACGRAMRHPVGCACFHAWLCMHARVLRRPALDLFRDTHTHTQTQTRAHITCECRYTRACRPPRKAPSPTARPRQHTLRRKPGAPPLSAACAATQLPPRQRRQRQRRRRVLPGCLRLFCHMRLHLLLQLRAAVVARCKVGHVVAMLGPP